MKIDKKDLWENLTLSNDFMFSKVMRDKEICRETLEILLDKKIGEITYIDNQKTIDINYDSKSVRLDVYVEDEQRIYNIEMQVVNKKDLSKNGTSKVFFNTKDYHKESKEDTKSFLEYIEKEKSSENNFVKKLEQKIRNIKENKEWRAEYMTILMREQEIARDNFEKGKIEGREEGIAEGVIKGREEGIAEGMVRGIKNLIESFKELGINEEVIVQKLIEKYGLSEQKAKDYLRK